MGKKKDAQKKKSKSPAAGGAAHDHDHAHDHGHAHAHDHAHDHDHARDHEADAPLPAAHVSPSARLERGEGIGRTLFFDAFSGLAGDMTIAALLDLGAPLSVVEEALAAIGLTGFELVVGRRSRSAIVATHFDVRVEAGQPRRDYAAIDAMLESSRLEAATKDLARRIFRRLGEAEARVHRTPLETVHFHEVGGVDAIVDIVGSAALLTYLGADVVATPVPMGRGFIRSEHGKMPNPPPAVVECLRGCPTYAVDVDFELVTPTGAAIVATVAKRFARWPSLWPSHVGYGAGTKDLADRPNLLRLVLGESALRDDVPAPSLASHVVLEANVDDMTGEHVAFAIEALLAAGALDAWAQPITMKKGRPGLVVSALAPVALADHIAEVVLRETTSLGVRKTPVSRLERPRREISVSTAFGEVRCKISEGPYGAPLVKPEHDDCARLARAAGVPVREVAAAALAAAKLAAAKLAAAALR